MEDIKAILSKNADGVFIFYEGRQWIRKDEALARTGKTLFFYTLIVLGIVWAVCGWHT